MIACARLDMRSILLCLYLSFSFLNVLGFERSTSSSCFLHDGHSFCYDTQPRHANIASIFDSINRIEAKHVSSHQTMDDEELSKARTSCRIAASSNYRLTLLDNSSLPLILFQPRYCVGFGNQIGFAFELISFALAKGIAFARVEAHDSLPVHQCSEARDARQLLLSLPKLVIPSKKSTVFTKEMCNEIPEWPWESASSFFFSQLPLLSFINHHMVMLYLQKSLNTHRRDMVPKLFSQSVAIHFRCSDNLAHASMGLLPYSEYNRSLHMIAKQPGMWSDLPGHNNNGVRSLVIFTDAHLYHSHGAICTRALAELEALISSQPKWQNLDLIVHRTTTIKTYAMMHISRFLLCSASTLCFFSAVGHDHAFVPIGNNIVIKLPTYSFQSNITFFQTRMIRPRKESMSADDFAKDFLST